MARSLSLICGIALAACSIETDGLAVEAPPDGGSARDGGATDAGPPAHDSGFDACGACECHVDGDCPAPTMGTWGVCTSDMGPCSATGVQERVDVVWRCVSGLCADFPNTYRQRCPLSTEGNECGAPSEGAWSDCLPAGGCAETGTQSRSVTRMVCRSETCTAEMTPETRDCTVDTSGDMCEGFAACWGTCGGGTCNEASGCGNDSDCDDVCPSGCTPRCVFGIGSCCWCEC